MRQQEITDTFHGPTRALVSRGKSGGGWVTKPISRFQ
jgi:hypothetical protein